MGDIERLISWIEKNERAVSTAMGVVVVMVLGGLVYSLALNGKLNLNLGPDVEVELLSDEEGNQITHVVAAGEGLSQIAQRYYGNMDLWPRIATANGITNPDMIEVGREIVIPEIGGASLPDIEPSLPPTPSPTPDMTGNKTYVVKRGDYLSKIAIEVYGNKDKWIDILNANRDKIKNPEVLEAGMVLVLP